MPLPHAFSRRPILLATLFIAACGSAPKPPASPTPARQSFQAVLAPNITLDYQVERKISGINQRTCYAFITGSLQNQTTQTLSRESIIDITVIQAGQALFRDLTNPVSDVPPGGRVMFRMVDSPVHKQGCPDYDRFDISLRKIIVP